MARDSNSNVIIKIEIVTVTYKRVIITQFKVDIV